MTNKTITNERHVHSVAVWGRSANYPIPPKPLGWFNSILKSLDISQQGLNPCVTGRKLGFVRTISKSDFITLDFKVYLTKLQLVKNSFV